MSASAGRDPDPLLPDQTGDDRVDPDDAARERDDDDDERLHRERPPHHDR
jgi:hypothetical protein